MNNNFKLVVVRNIGFESESTFGNRGSIVDVVDGRYIDNENFTWNNDDNYGNGFKSPEEFMRYFAEEDHYQTEFKLYNSNTRKDNRRDFYLSEDNAYNRLLEEYNRYGRIIIAYDFDDTIYDFHKKGRSYSDVIDLLKRWREHAVFICFTSSQPERQREIWEYIIKNDIPCDYLNTGVPGLPNGDKKIYYNVLLDDRAGLGEVYGTLNRLINHIEREV